jgi:hypothetical protein
MKFIRVWDKDDNPIWLNGRHIGAVKFVDPQQTRLGSIVISYGTAYRHESSPQMVVDLIEGYPDSA